MAKIFLETLITLFVDRSKLGRTNWKVVVGLKNNHCNHSVTNNKNSGNISNDEKKKTVDKVGVD